MTEAGEGALRRIGDRLVATSPLMAMSDSELAELDAALARARARLEAMAVDPKRHARHALKVLIKFRLLYMESETIAEMRAGLAEASVLVDAARQVDMSIDEAIEWAVDSLVAGGQAMREGDRVFDGD